jgi:putative transposase
VRRACAATGFPRSTHTYRAHREPQDALRLRLRERAASRVRYGYRRPHVLLRREGWAVNLKRAYRPYRQEQLTLRRRKPRRRVSCRQRADRPPVAAADQVWAMGFMSDALADGRAFRVLTVLDVYTRECLAIRVEPRFSSEQVAKVLEGAAYLRGVPQSLRIDNGPEFTGRMLDLWAYSNGVTPDFSEPGKPTDNAFIESFDGRPREGCLNQHYFTSIAEARATAEAWRVEYNEHRPHSALGNLAPGEFARSKAGVKEPQPSRRLA